MRDAGLALNATFKGQPVAGWTEGSGTKNTTVGVPIVIELPLGGGEQFDYVVSMEDLHFGQRIANYSFEYQVPVTWFFIFCIFTGSLSVMLDLVSIYVPFTGHRVERVEHPHPSCYCEQDEFVPHGSINDSLGRSTRRA